MNSTSSSLLSAFGKIFTSIDVLLFLGLSFLLLLVSAYFYNQKFPNHKYPVLLEFLSYVA
ncbi:hypothetical protein QUF99_00375 [Bacillus sp. DX4.1]|uniref:hypothetical protein n=1 Tax=Bacillus sp. DX4.1 TaxID=3055867 RepID=UPI0025A2E530|nr:hypothetical protein [Bacillus sp. DX4.1]MDM5185956.1 hypothetical protein [Bacillus sp. DX4.1]